MHSSQTMLRNQDCKMSYANLFAPTTTAWVVQKSMLRRINCSTYLLKVMFLELILIQKLHFCNPIEELINLNRGKVNNFGVSIKVQSRWSTINIFAIGNNLYCSCSWGQVPHNVFFMQYKIVKTQHKKITLVLC